MADEATTGRSPSRARKAPARAARNGGARRDQEVLDAATKVFHSRGYADASVQDIATRAGISVPARVVCTSSRQQNSQCHGGDR